MTIYLSLPILDELVRLVENDSTYRRRSKGNGFRNSQLLFSSGQRLDGRSRTKLKMTNTPTSSFAFSVVSLETEASLITQWLRRSVQAMRYKPPWNNSKMQLSMQIPSSGDVGPLWSMALLSNSMNTIGIYPNTHDFFPKDHPTNSNKTHSMHAMTVSLLTGCWDTWHSTILQLPRWERLHCDWFVFPLWEMYLNIRLQVFRQFLGLRQSMPKTPLYHIEYKLPLDKE